MYSKFGKAALLNQQIPVLHITLGSSIYPDLIWRDALLCTWKHLKKTNSREQILITKSIKTNLSQSLAPKFSLKEEQIQFYLRQYDSVLVLCTFILAGSKCSCILSFVSFLVSWETSFILATILHPSCLLWPPSKIAPSSPCWLVSTCLLVELVWALLAHNVCSWGGQQERHCCSTEYFCASCILATETRCAFRTWNGVLVFFWSHTKM